MPRSKPTLKLGVYGSFDLRPQEAVTSFFESKLQNKLYSKGPCWDVPREGLQHESIENEREFVEMSTQQEVFQKKAAIQKKINEKRTDDMQGTQLQLRGKFIKVNEFIQECSGKIMRSQNRIDSEQEQQVTLKEEIASVEHDLNELSTFESKFKEIIEEFKPYEEVFEKAIKSSDTYESFDDLVSKADALLIVQVEIAEREQDLIKGMELVRQKMLKSTYEASKKIIEMNTELADMERNYNNVQAETFKWEKILSNSKDFISENEKETVTLVDSIQHLYLLLAVRNDEKTKLKKYDISGQLDYIRDEIEILEKIIRRAHHKMAKEKMSLLGEGSNRFLKVDKGTNFSD